MSCLAPNYNPVPTRMWSRVQSSCSLVIPTTTITKADIIALQMQRKGNTLQYKANSSNLTKQQQYSLLAQGKWINRTKTWATQGASSSNPNTHHLTRVGNTLLCPSPAEICVPTSSSDVPGPIVNLCYNDTLSTFYPRQNIIMNTSTNGFPKGVKWLVSANASPIL